MSAGTLNRKARLVAPETMSPEMRRMHKQVLARQDLVRVAQLVGLPEGEGPSIRDYARHGRYGARGIQKAAGATRWSAALTKFRLGYDRYRRGTPRAKVRDDLHRVAKLLGYPTWLPSSGDYEAHGEYTIELVMRRLDCSGWQEVAGAVALRYRYGNAYPLSNEDMLTLYRTLSEAAGRKRGEKGLNQKEFAKASGYTKSAVVSRFGSWNVFVQRAGFRPIPAKGGWQKRVAREAAQQAAAAPRRAA